MENLKWVVRLTTAGLFFCFCLLAIPPTASADDGIEIDRFISPETCADCHSQIFEQWKNSMHNLSHADPVYNRVAQFLRKGLLDKGEIEEAESCVKCHTPVGHLTGFPKKLTDNLSKTPELATQGIQCDYCHSAIDVQKMYNNGLVLEPGQGEDDPGVKYGPFDDAVPDFHEAAYSELHTEARICGTCHDVKHVAFGTDLETTYTEWEKSPYNAKDPAQRIACQGCHMHQRPGIPATGSTDRPLNPGAATDYSDERPHIFTHYFVGGNAAVPAGFGGEEKAQMAVERLKNAATLTLDTTGISEKKLIVTVANVGAGHSIPTGVGDLRQVWLEIVVRNKDSQVLYDSGVLNGDRELGQGAVIFRTIFGDGQGRPVMNIAKARQVLKDSRIAAKEKVDNVFHIPVVPAKGSVVTARLLYRSMPQKLLKLVPGKPFEPLPVIEMAAVRQVL